MWYVCADTRENANSDTRNSLSVACEDAASGTNSDTKEHVCDPACSRPHGGRIHRQNSVQAFVGSERREEQEVLDGVSVL